MFRNTKPTFAALPKRTYEIDYHVNHNHLKIHQSLQRSKYMKIDDDVPDFGSDNENKIELNLAYCKSYVVERKNRRIL